MKRIRMFVLASAIAALAVSCGKKADAPAVESVPAVSVPEAPVTVPAQDVPETPVPEAEPPVQEDVLRGQMRPSLPFATDLYGTGAAGTHGAAASASPLASQIAVQILEEGGNAVDAAVAMIYAVGLLEPAASGIGGCGQMVVYLADQDTYETIEYMETAPAAVVAGQTDTTIASNPPSVQAIAIPGTVHGTLTALEKWGTMTPAQVLEPVIALARGGFRVTDRWNANIEGRYENLSAYPYSMGLYTDEGFLYSEGDVVTNNDLADTLELVARGGIKGFYDSEFTDKMVDYIQSQGGIVTHDDFANYASVVREPISTTYRGHKVYTVGGPSTGGAALLEALNITEHFDLASYGFDNPVTAQIKAEAFILGQKDGRAYMGDPDYYHLPVDEIISKEYGDQRAGLITPGKKMLLAPAGRHHVTLTSTGKEAFASMAVDQGGTTHMVVMDAKGNVVSTTNTNGINFGSALAVPGTGFVFNAHLANLTNNPTSSVNVLMPGIRVCSTICPTIVADADGKPEIAVGSPGNWCTASATYETIVNCIDFGMDVASAVNAPRSWNAGGPKDQIYLEGSYSPETIKGMQDLGFNTLDSDLPWSSHVGSVSAAEMRDGVYYAVGDNRRHYGAAAY